MNRFGGQSSPWASGAPPMYGPNSAPPPPPQYGGPAYGQTTAPWNVAPQMRSTAGGWGAPTPPMPPMQPQQRRPNFNNFNRPVSLDAYLFLFISINIRFKWQPMSGPTGKRGNQSWEGPPNKRFNKQGNQGGGGGGGNRGGQGGGNWRHNNNQNKQNRNFNNNRNNNRNNNNNRELNRTKQIDSQLERVCLKSIFHLIWLSCLVLSFALKLRFFKHFITFFFYFIIIFH